MDTNESKQKNNKVVKAGIGYMIGNYLLKGFAIITVPIFARLLSVSDFGVFSIFVTYENIFFVLVGCAIHSSYKNAFYKYGSDDSKEAANYYSYVSNTMIFLIVSGAIWLLAFLVFSKQIGSLMDLETPVIILIILYSFSSATLQCFNADRSLRYEYKSYIKVSAINALSNFSLSLILIFTLFSDQRYMGRIFGTTVPMVIIALVIIASFLKRARPKQLKKTLPWGIKFSLPIVPHGLSQIVLNQLDRVMIRSMAGNMAAGQYSFAYTLCSILTVTFTSLDTVWSPWIFERLDAGEYDVIKRNSSLYIKYVFMFCVCVLLFSPELILLLGGYKYKESVYCVIPIIAGIFFLFLYYLPAGIEYFFEKTQYIAIGSIAAAFINVGLNLVCIKQFGYIAAAYTTLASYFLYFCFHYFIARRIFGSFLFSNKAIWISAFGIIAAAFMVRFIIGYMIIRFVMILIVLIGMCYSAEKDFGIKEIISERLKK